MLPRTFLTRLTLTLMLLTVSLPAAPGQRLDDGELELEKQLRKTKGLRRDLFTGATHTDPRNKEHLEAIDLEAKEITYPLVWKTQSRTWRDGDINLIVERFEGILKSLNKFRATTRELQPIYCKQVIERALEVAQRGRPIAAVNATRILALIPARRVDREYLIPEKEWIDEVLPRLAEGTGEHLAAACLTLLDDPKTTDGSRYYLFQALADLLGVNREQAPVLKPQTAEKICAVAARAIEKKMAFPRATPRAEVEGYKMLRLQAVKVLAWARAPSVGKERPALLLARLAGNDDDIVPPPSTGERIEAVVGLGRMSHAVAKSNDLHPDYAAVQICRAVADFATEASANIDSKPVVRFRPWKVDAGRLIEAAEAWQADVKLPYVQVAMKQCLAVLGPIEGGRAAASNDLVDWLDRNEPANKTLFRGEAGSVVKSAAPKGK